MFKSSIVLISLLLVVSCTTDYESKVLPHPETGKEVEVTEVTNKFCGIPYDTDIAWPVAKKTTAELNREARQGIYNKAMNLMWYGLILGGLGIAGLAASFAFSNRAVMNIGILALCLSVGGIIVGILGIGLSLAWNILIIVLGVVFLISIGIAVYKLRDFSIVKLIKDRRAKWQSRK